MLVLSRKIGENLVIGENIIVRILDVRGDMVKIGIDAPWETSIHRQEVYDLIQQENKAAAKVKKDVFASLPTKVDK